MKFIQLNETALESVLTEVLGAEGFFAAARLYQLVAAAEAAGEIAGASQGYAKGWADGYVRGYAEEHEAEFRAGWYYGHTAGEQSVRARIVEQFAKAVTPVVTIEPIDLAVGAAASVIYLTDQSEQPVANVTEPAPLTFPDHPVTVLPEATFDDTALLNEDPQPVTEEQPFTTAEPVNELLYDAAAIGYEQHD